MKLKSAKLPEWAHRNAADLQAELVRRGLNSLPADLLRPTECPACGSKVESIDVNGDSYIECQRCSYRQAVPGDDGAGMSHISVGHILDIGIAALWRELEE